MVLIKLFLKRCFFERIGGVRAEVSAVSGPLGQLGSQGPRLSFRTVTADTGNIEIAAEENPCPKL